MPVTTSAKKALRADRRRQAINLKIKQAFKETLNKFRKKPTKKNLAKASSELDKAVKKKYLYKNKASRLKSRLAKLLKKAK